MVRTILPQLCQRAICRRRVSVCPFVTNRYCIETTVRIELVLAC